MGVGPYGTEVVLILCSSCVTRSFRMTFLILLPAPDDDSILVLVLEFLGT